MNQLHIAPGAVDNHAVGSLKHIIKLGNHFFVHRYLGTMLPSNDLDRTSAYSAHFCQQKIHQLCGFAHFEAGHFGRGSVICIFTHGFICFLFIGFYGIGSMSGWTHHHGKVITGLPAFTHYHHAALLSEIFHSFPQCFGGIKIASMVSFVTL